MMKNFIPSLIRRLKNAIQKGISAYSKTISEDDPRLTLYIFGWLKNIGKGLWNGAKGALGGFFGGGGGGGTPTQQPIIIEPGGGGGGGVGTSGKKPNILLYAGIGVGIIIFFVIIMMVFKRK